MSIPYGRQDITQSDIDAVVSVLRSDFLTQGPQVPAFELAVREHCGVRQALACNSATSALHMACLALGLGPGDTLWTSPITFVASANCGLYCGAAIDFVDIDPATFNMCPEALAEKLSAAEKTGKLPKILVVVHMCGQSAEMEPISILARKYGIRIIEDASHAIGGRYRDKPIGDCRYSDITVFSFHPVKIITTAEGGIVTTNSDELANHMSLLRSHGITRNQDQMTKAPDGPWYYEQIELGWNFRMTDMQAALGRSQIERLDAYVGLRHAHAEVYDKQLADLPIILPWRRTDTHSAFHLYVIQLKETERRLKVFEDLRQRGIGVNVHYIPVHLQPYYQQFGFRKGDFPLAEKMYAGAISLPLFAQMTSGQRSEVIKKVHEVLA